MKKILALCLVCAMLAMLLAACGSTTADTQSSESEETVTTETAAEETSEAEETEPAEEAEEAAEPVEDAEEEENDADEITEIEMYIINRCGNSEAAFDRIQDAVNAISEPEIGVHVNFHEFSFFEYQQQVAMEIAAGTQIDMVQAISFGAITYSNMLANGQLMDISQWIYDLCPNVVDEVGQYLDMYSGANGEIYGFPMSRIYSTSEYIVMRKDILDELGLTDFARNMTTWSEYEEILAAVTDAYSGENFYGVADMTTDGIAWPTDNFADAVSADYLGDSLKVLSIGEDGKVYDLYENEGYMQKYKMAAEWNANGWIYPDAAYTDITEDDQLRQNISFSNIGYSEFGVEAAKSSTIGTDVVCVDAADNVLTSAEIYSISHVVPVTAEEPEAALKFVNLLYGSEELMNLMAWGEEGTDWEYNEDGEAVYPEGKSLETADIYHNADYLFGNQYLVAPWDGQGGNFREEAREYQNNAPVSTYLGFAIDSAAVSDYLAPIQAVKDEYEMTMGAGGYTDETYEQMVDKLKAAGIDDYAAALQQQVDTWMAAQ